MSLVFSGVKPNYSECRQVRQTLTKANTVSFVSRFVNVLLPSAARQEGVRVRWWQPQHDGADHSDWALDNVLIAGSDPRAQISDTFGGVALPNHERAPADETSGRVRDQTEQEEAPIGMTRLNKELIWQNIKKNNALKKCIFPLF